MTWIDIVGYQHEVLHTGVLAALLSETEVGPELASALIGYRGDSAAPVVEVGSPKREAKLPGAPGTADLTAELRLLDDTSRALAVETKVHSSGTTDQLERLPGRAVAVDGVLLAVGKTELRMSESHLPPALDARGPRWRFFDAASWQRMLSGLSSSPWYLAEYLAALEAEAARNREAREHAWSGAPADPDAREFDRLQLAWLAEVREQLLPVRWFPTHTHGSGQEMALWGGWKHRGVEIYFDFMANRDGRRELVLKCIAANATPTLGEVRDLMLGWPLGEAGIQASTRRVGARYKSCTVGSADLTTASPDEAARVAREAEDRLLSDASDAYGGFTSRAGSD